MDIVELIEACIKGLDGGSVSSQFKDSWENGDFDDQNNNALRIISMRIKELLKSGLLKDEVTQEVKDYLEELDYYLVPTFGHNNKK